MSKAGASSPEAAPQLSSSAPGCPSSPLLRPRLHPLAPLAPGQLHAEDSGWKCCFARTDGSLGALERVQHQLLLFWVKV